MKRLILALLSLLVPLGVAAQSNSLAVGYYAGGSAYHNFATTNGYGGSAYAPSSNIMVGYNATGVKPGATYTSGGSATGAASTTCTVTITGGTTNAVGTLSLNAMNTIAASTPITFTNNGTGYGSPPTAGTLSSGTATCSGSVVVSTVLGVYAPIGVDANGNIVPGGACGGDLSGTFPSCTVVGIQGAAVPALATGYLNYTGSVWAYTVPVTSFTGDGTVISNAASTGATTATLATHAANTVLAGPTSGAASAPTFRTLTAADIGQDQVVSTAGDLICAKAADSTVGAVSITAVNSTSNSLTFTTATTEPYFAAGQQVQAQGNTTSGYNGGPWTVFSNSGTTVVVTSAANPGAGTAGGTLSLYCSNQSLDGSQNYLSFATSYTFAAGALGTTVKSVTAKPQFGIFSSSSAAPFSAFIYELNGTQVFKSSSSIALNPAASSANTPGTYPLTITVPSAYTTASGTTPIYTTITPFSLGITALTDVNNLGTLPIGVSNSTTQLLTLLARYKGTAIQSGTYTSGGSIVGTATQTCNLSFSNSYTATATVALTGTNTIAGGTALTILTQGQAGTGTAPTTGTFTSGTATCSGTPTIATVTMGAAGNAILLYAIMLTP